EALARGEMVQHLETERIQKDGRRVHLSLTFSPIRDGDGAVIGISEIARDISERKAAKQALRASEERFSLFMRHLPGLAFTKDAAGHVTFINENHKRVMGWQGDEWSGKTAQELFPPEVADLMDAHYREVLQTREPLQ